MLMAHLIWVAWATKKYQPGMTHSETENKNPVIVKWRDFLFFEVVTSYTNRYHYRSHNP